MSWNQNSCLCAKVAGLQRVEGPSRAIEKQGLLANGTWDESNIRPRSEILAMAESSGNNIHIGFLMARIVFWGDAVKDEENQAAVFDDIAASGLWTPWWQWNFHQRLHQNLCSVSFEFIPTYFCGFTIELVPDHAKHIYQPCAPLIKSLYGHSLASASWQSHLSKVLAQKLGGLNLSSYHHTFIFQVFVGIVSFCGWFDVMRSLVPITPSVGKSWEKLCSSKIQHHSEKCWVEVTSSMMEA